MGAELVLCGYPVPTGGFDVEGAKRALATVTNVDLYEAFAELDPVLADELPEVEGDQPSPAREVAEQRLGECIEVLTNQRCDAGIFTFHGPACDVRVWLTGGMTWGDSPTEAFDQAQTINLLPTPVLDALLRRDASSP
jgi:hypothetical protein